MSTIVRTPPTSNRRQAATPGRSPASWGARLLLVAAMAAGACDDDADWVDAPPDADGAAVPDAPASLDAAEDRPADLPPLVDGTDVDGTAGDGAVGDADVLADGPGPDDPVCPPPGSPGTAGFACHDIQGGKPSLAVAPDGTAFVAWVCKGDSLCLARRDPMSAPSGWNALVGHDTIRVDHTAIAINQAGNPILAWHRWARIGGFPPSTSLVEWTGTAWQLWDDLPDIDRVTVSAHADGSLSATGWTKERDVRVVRRENGRWGPVGEALAPPGTILPVVPPVLVGNRAGVLALAWDGSSSAQRRRWEKGVWSVPPGPPMVGSDARPAINEAGLAAYGWKEAVASGGATVAVLVDGWPEPKRLPHASAVSALRDLAIDSQGRPLVLWSRRDPGAIFLDRWTGDRWETLAGPILLEDHTAPPRGALVIAGGDRPTFVVSSLLRSRFAVFTPAD